MGLTTIRTFDNAPEAHVFRIKLENSGINSYIFDEETITLDPLMTVALGGIKLKVDQTDFDKALNIISEIENSPLTNENNEILKCPKCDSTELYTGFKSMRGTKGIISTIISFLFWVYPLSVKNVYKCKNCGNEFNRK